MFNMQRSCWRQLSKCCIFCLLVMSMFHGAEAQEVEYALCGDCPCIHGDDEPCPTDDKLPPTVPTDFPPELIGFLRSLEVTNAYDLDCDPYSSEDCETVPQQTLVDLDETAVCGVIYEETEEECPQKYSLMSYASQEDLEADDNAVLTHYGACGVCSTLQDLAVYIEYIDQVAKATECSCRF